MNLQQAIERYCKRSAIDAFHPQTVLFDMDGVLYDSMPRHARAWKGVCDEVGIEADADEFFAYEGRTGASTIDILIRREFGRPATDEECRSLYKRKTELFADQPLAPVMHGAQDAVATVVAAGAVPVLVTGSGQGSLLDRLDADYDGAFAASRRVTAYDVEHGKPHPEPYLKGLAKAGVDAIRGIGVDNAPLGVESSSRAGLFTIGVRTGPLRPGTLLEAGADIELESMEECAQALATIFAAQQ